MASQAPIWVPVGPLTIKKEVLPQPSLSDLETSKKIAELHLKLTSSYDEAGKEFCQEVVDNYKAMLSKLNPELLRLSGLELLHSMEGMLPKTQVAGKEPIIKLLLCKAIWEAGNVLPRYVHDVIANLEAILNHPA